MSGYFGEDPRPLGPDDAQSTRVLLLGALGVTPYIDRALETLDRTERCPDDEHRGLLIERDGTVAGLALFGRITGAEGATRLNVLALAPEIDPDEVGGRLIASVSTLMRDEGARFLMAELPDDPALGSVLAVLREHGFREEARVPDFYRDGVALTFMRFDLDGSR